MADKSLIDAIWLWLFHLIQKAFQKKAFQKITILQFKTGTFPSKFWEFWELEPRSPFLLPFVDATATIQHITLLDTSSSLSTTRVLQQTSTQTVIWRPLKPSFFLFVASFLDSLNELNVFEIRFFKKNWRTERYKWMNKSAK